MKGSRWNKPLVPERFREARMARGLKATELAKRIGVTRQAISQYELGITSPKPEILDKIVQELSFPMAFFHTAIAYRVSSPVFFRSPNAAVVEQDMMIPRINWLREIMCFLRQYIDFQNPHLEEIAIASEVEDDYEIEGLAVKLREAWDLGLGPISNVLRLAENNGFIAAKVGIAVEKADACSMIDTNDDKRPVLFLLNSKSAVRSRFDVAHEIGHVVLHSWADEEYLRDKDNHKRMEQQAHRFASAFLMPAETFSRELFSTSIESLIPLKRRWGVSISAISMRLRDLEMITDNQHRYLQIQISQKRWRKEEPLDAELQHERPSTLRKAIELLIDEGIVTKEDLLKCMPLERDEICTLCSLNEDFFVSTEKKAPHLRLIKS